MRYQILQRPVVFGLVLWLSPSMTMAQSLIVDAGAMLGAGVERGATQNESAVVRSPVFADINVRAFTDEDDRVAFGGSARIEMTGLGGLALVPRAELRHKLGTVELRPGIAFPIFIMPKTLLGPEASCAFRIPLSRGLGLQTMVFVTAYLAGANLPANASLIQFGGALGLSLYL